ncbi:MAG: InlB B-repeat-containing protein, partial [Firmicutes bacterium]|nr:InlB B-repeat-containing protein [Bacillota bacterium]
MTKHLMIRPLAFLFCLLMLTGILAIAAEPVWADTTPGFAVQPQTVYRPKNGNAVLSFSLNFDPEGQDARLAIERPDPVLGTVYYWIDQNFTDPEGNPAVTKQNMTIVVNWQWERDDPYVIRLDYNGSEYRSDPFYIIQERGFIVQPNSIWLDAEGDPDAEKKVSFELNFTPQGDRIYLFRQYSDVDFAYWNITDKVTSAVAGIYLGKDYIDWVPYYIVIEDISGREYKSEPFYVLKKGVHLFTSQPEDVLVLDGQPAEVSWSVDYYPEPFTQMAGHTAGATFWITGGKIGFHQSLKLISAYYEIKGDNQGISIEEDRDMSITVDADWVSVAPYQIVNIPLTSPSGGGHRFGSRMFYIREAWTVRYHMGAAYDRPDTSEHVLTGELANLPKMPAEINGYVFGGWYTDSGFTQSYDSSAPVTGTLDLYARWNKRSYEVSFDLVGGTSAAIPAQIISYGNTVAAPADPTKPGGTFAGWYTDPNYEHVYDFSRPVSEALILYAKWNMQTFLVSFNNRGIGTKPATQTVTYGAIAVEPKKLYQNGYIFGGWYTNGGFTEDHHFDFSTPITQHTNLNAKWTKLCTVTFKPGEGS